ncbi:MAG TPA: AAA family ATPase, partial [Methylomirabilota bacterium]|nr:AAA family ATPase [Methylomirabilota bacterium]
KTTQTIKSLITDQVLYLQTYRRIEQDLASIFHGSLSSELRSSIERWTRRAESTSYIELVEFGMQDVEKTIQKKMSELKDSLRDDLNNLTGTYLRDVIQGAYRSAEPSKISELDEVTMDAIFSRIDKEILPVQQQKRLRDIVAKIKRDNSVPEGDKVVVHFLTRLIELYKAQQDNERDVREFVRVCNIYLTGKEIVYDNLKFDISVYQENGIIRGKEENDLRTIAMKMLSSGEKQIVSLFSHIYLSGSSGYYVIIDEPELSLSVFWQKRFLPDILETGRCNGLIAVTHSPFIFENQLEKYTHSLDEFMEPLNGISR